MLSIFLGPNIYEKRQYIQDLAQKAKAELVFFGTDEAVNVQSLLEIDLFSKPKVFVLFDVSILAPSQREGRGEVEKLISTRNQIVVCVESLDKRKKETKELLANSDIITKEFLLPHGKELDQWIVNSVASLGGKISTEAANELAVRLGRDQAKETKFGGKVVSVEEIYSLEQAENEIKKLISFVQGQEISVADIKELVSENGEVDALEITNALAEKDKRALELISKFLQEQTASDEKGSIIQLNALLSEQFRNVYMAQEFLAGKTSEADILDKTGWKSGRLFIMKKIAARFKPQTISETLSKLAALDEELKTSQTPPRVLLDLILAQLL